jgi:hypothetical protein
MEARFLAEIKQLDPSPPPNAEFVFHDLPTQMLGIDFHVAGLQDAIRIDLARDDITAQRAPQDHAPQRLRIDIEWLGTKERLIEHSRT